MCFYTYTACPHLVHPNPSSALAFSLPPLFSNERLDHFWAEDHLSPIHRPSLPGIEQSFIQMIKPGSYLHSFMLPFVPLSTRSGLIVKRLGQLSKDHFKIIDIPFIATPDAIPSW